MRLAVFLLLTVSIFAANCEAGAKEYSIGAQEESRLIEAKVLDAPTPEIPSDMHEEAFKTTVTARFNIAADGKVAVALLAPSGNEDIDRVVLNTLKKWRFAPAMVNDAPVASSRKLKIELEVE